MSSYGGVAATSIHREEVMLLGEAEPDVATEVPIECVLADRIEPAIQALAEAAAYRPKGEG